MFVLYRYLYTQLGVKQIGIWSLILATVSVSRIGELGLSAGVVRFVAQANGDQNLERASTIIQTVLIALGGVLTVLLLLLAPLVEVIASKLVPPDSLHMALAIIPIALASLWLMTLGSVISGGLDGCYRTDLRCYITAGSQIGYLAIALFLVPKLGLLGVAWAQLLQYIALVFFLWITLRSQIKQLPIIPKRFNIKILREIFSYGIHFQAISIVGLLFDPLVKVLLSKFGGMSSVGYYDIANNLILKCRSILIEASRVMVPLRANIKDDAPEESKSLFLCAHELNAYIAIYCYGVLAILTSSVSILILGHRQDDFIQFALILNIGWLLNTMIGPAYFNNLGSGKLRPNMISHLLTSLTTSIFGVMGGLLIGDLGVIFSTSLGLILGGVFLLYAVTKQLGLPWRIALAPKYLPSLLLSGVLCAAFSNFAIQQTRMFQDQTLLIAGTALIFTLLAVAHPLRQTIFALLKRQ